MWAESVNRRLSIRKKKKGPSVEGDTGIDLKSRRMYQGTERGDKKALIVRIKETMPGRLSEVDRGRGVLSGQRGARRFGEEYHNLEDV